MKLTSMKFYKLSLLIPYLVFLFMLPFVFIKSDVMNSPFGLLLIPIVMISIVYMLGAPYWLPPYTLLVIILWIWSRKKNKSQIFKIFIWSPFYLGILTALFCVVVSYFKLFPNLFYLSNDILSTSLACMFPTPIAFGYFFIGLTAWIYNYMQRRGIIVDEENNFEPRNTGI